MDAVSRTIAEDEVQPTGESVLRGNGLEFLLRRFAGGHLFPLASGDVVAGFTPEWVGLRDIESMRVDPQLVLGLACLKAPIVNTSRYFLHPSGDDRVDGLVRAVVRKSLCYLINTCLLALDYGFVAAEKVWGAENTRLEAPDGTTSGMIRKAIVPVELNQLAPANVEVRTQKTGRFSGVRFDSVDLAPSQLLYLTYRGEFNRIHGDSLLRPAYVPWRFASVIHKLWGRFCERFALGVWKGRAPGRDVQAPGSTSDDPKNVPALKAMSTLLLSLMGSGSIALPSEYDANGNPVWDAELVESTREGTVFSEAAQFFNALKLRAILVPERVVTQDVLTGSHSMASAHAEVFFLMLDQIVDTLVLEPINAQWIRPIVTANFGSDVRAPRLAAARLSREQRGMLFELLKGLTGSPLDRVTGQPRSLSHAIDVPTLLRQLNVPSLAFTAEDVAPLPNAPADGAGEEEAPAPSRGE